MDKRTVLFLILSLLVLTVYFTARTWLLPPPPVVAEREFPPLPEREEVPPPAERPLPEQAPAGEQPALPAGEAEPAPALEHQRFTLGSLDPAGPFRLLVTLSNQGGVIERVELTDPHFRDLEDRGGYVGHLGLKPVKEGLRITVVGVGTPAHTAGLTPDDTLLAIDDSPLASAEELALALRRHRPGDRVTFRVAREGAPTPRNVEVRLDRRPLEVIQPEADPLDPAAGHPLSFQLALAQNKDKPFATLLRRAPWEAKEIPEGVEFRYRLNEAELAAAGRQGELEIVKRYQLRPQAPTEGEAPAATGYSLQFTVELRNVGETPQADLSYMLDGPTGLPLEGWWYSYKVATGWSAGGARDVIGQAFDGSFVMQICSAIVKNSESNKPEASDLLNTGERLRFLGGDTQYFCAVMQAVDPTTAPVAQRAFARPVAELDPINKSKRTDVSFRFIPQGTTLAPGESLAHSYEVFVGPKRPELLARHGIDHIIQYGWFGPVAKLMLFILHLFHAVIPNYGIAIILLTVMVRGMMLPIGRQAAKNAQMMQVMAPELAKIKEKYKNDLQKQGQAQQELFRRYKYNPMTGCLLMFMQLPVFIGLYRGLSVDIELRQAPLIPGLDWASNLAGPDMLLRWDAWLPEFLASENGYLGPYLNVLPLVTVVLFVVQQKLFTPPPTDDQTRMQHQVMMFMTVFIGFLFFRVPAGLCLYFIISSLWGVGERLLLPKPKLPGELTGDAEEPPKSPIKGMADRLAKLVSGPEKEPKKRNGRRVPKKR